FTSIMKRAPGRASASFRLRRVGSACARSAGRSTPASRSATSCLLRATISPSTPVTSAMARLHEQVEAPVGLAGAERVPGAGDTLAQILRQARNHQQRAGIERD